MTHIPELPPELRDDPQPLDHTPEEHAGRLSAAESTWFDIVDLELYYWKDMNESDRQQLEMLLDDGEQEVYSYDTREWVKMTFRKYHKSKLFELAQEEDRFNRQSNEATPYHLDRAGQNPIELDVDLASAEERTIGILTSGRTRFRFDPQRGLEAYSGDELVMNDHNIDYLARVYEEDSDGDNNSASNS